MSQNFLFFVAWLYTQFIISPIHALAITTHRLRHRLRRTRGTKEFVLKSFDNNIEISVISSITDLTMEEVLSILNDNKRL